MRAVKVGVTRETASPMAGRAGEEGTGGGKVRRGNNPSTLRAKSGNDILLW